LSQTINRLEQAEIGWNRPKINHLRRRFLG